MRRCGLPLTRGIFIVSERAGVSAGLPAIDPEDTGDILTRRDVRYGIEVLMCGSWLVRCGVLQTLLA